MIILPRSEQARILHELDKELDRRKQPNGKPANEDPALTFTWNMISRLRTFCGFLGFLLGPEQIMAMEKEAAKRNIATPGVLVLDLYRVLTNREKREMAPKWLKDLFPAEDSKSADGSKQVPG